MSSYAHKMHSKACFFSQPLKKVKIMELFDIFFYAQSSNSTLCLALQEHSNIDQWDILIHREIQINIKCAPLSFLI